MRNQHPHHSIDQLPRVAAEWLAKFNAAHPTTQIWFAQTKRIQWKPPHSFSFKINYDGVVYSISNCSGIGIVIRDHRGLVIASLAQNLNQAYKPVEIEAMAGLAATRGIEFAAEIDVDRVLIERDLSVVMEALRSKNVGLASYDLLIEDTKLVERNFSELSYSHTKRKGNKVTHGLARLALSLSDTVVWMENVPPSIFHFVQIDLYDLSE